MTDKQRQQLQTEILFSELIEKENPKTEEEVMDVVAKFTEMLDNAGNDYIVDYIDN